MHRSRSGLGLAALAGLALLVALAAAACTPVTPVAVAGPNALERRAAASGNRPVSPIGVDWLVVWVDGFAGDPSRLLPLPGLILVPEGRTLSGNSSCNRFRAGYLYDAASGRLSFTNLVNTRRMCQRANAEAENAILAALLATDGFRLQEGTLELQSKGRPVARLVAK